MSNIDNKESAEVALPFFGGYKGGMLRWHKRFRDLKMTRYNNILLSLSQIEKK
jgi:hypothetical protein